MVVAAVVVQLVIQEARDLQELQDQLDQLVHQELQDQLDQLALTDQADHKVML
jgi:hypothetical protein